MNRRMLAIFASVASPFLTSIFTCIPVPGLLAVVVGGFMNNQWLIWAGAALAIVGALGVVTWWLGAIG